MSSECAIQTILRIRPPHSDHKLRVIKNSVSIEKNQTEDLVFSFDTVYKSTSKQESIFKEVELYLDNIGRGINTTIMAYGATGSGKTYTMSGTDLNPGIVPRVAESLFVKYLSTLSVLFSVEIRLSYIEIYNEKVFDLLGDGSMDDLPVRADAQGKVVVQGMKKERLLDEAAFKALFSKGLQRRKSAKTLLNSESSRSHSVLTFYITLCTDTSTVTTKINLVDLAGSENNKRTGNEGVQMVESASINKSLFVLNKVVDSLSKGESRIPYRDSKLTRILQDSLGGLSDCVLVVNIKGDSSAETLSTLAFAGKSRHVKTKPIEEKLKANPWTAISTQPLKPSKSIKVSYSSKNCLFIRQATRSMEDRQVMKYASAQSTRQSSHQSNGFIHSQGKHPFNAHQENAPPNTILLPTAKKQKKKSVNAFTNMQKYSLSSLLCILNSGDFLKIKSLPMIGDMRAEKIIKHTKETAITSIADLKSAGIPKKVVSNLSAFIDT
ncbi:kinesin family member 22 [Nematocida sp. AWRm80]|nr:kinesin family member 22 [Nematocida sp. AWRm80]